MKEIEEEMEKDDDITKIEKIKIYHNKKRSSQIKDKPIKNIYHNEIYKKENNENKIIRNNSKIKKPSLKITSTNQALDNNLYTTERTFDKKNDLHCLTMSTTPKGKFANNFRNVISLNKGIKLSKSIVNNKSKKKLTYERNRRGNGKR